MQKKNKKVIGVSIIAIFCIAAGIFSAHWGYVQSSLWIDQIVNSFKAISEGHPLFYFISLAVLPLIGFPVTPLYIAGGLIYGFPNAFFWGIPGVALNLLIVFLISQHYFRPALLGVIHRLGHKGWQIDPKENWRFTLLVRATPGPPIALQNYLLALGGVRFWPFFIISLPVEAVHLTVFSLSAGSGTHGHYGLALTGLSLIAVLAILPHFIEKIRKRYERTK